MRLATGGDEVAFARDGGALSLVQPLKQPIRLRHRTNEPRSRVPVDLRPRHRGPMGGPDPGDGRGRPEQLVGRQES